MKFSAADERMIYKLGDFGLSRFASERMTEGVGTAYYRAPEVGRKGDGTKQYGPPVDVYAFGKLLQDLFGRGKESATLRRIAERCVVPEPKKRPNAFELYKEIARAYGLDAPALIPVPAVMPAPTAAQTRAPTGAITPLAPSGAYICSRHRNKSHAAI